MKIIKQIYNEILHESFSSISEIGGILGGNDSIINQFEFDKGLYPNSSSVYIPNTEKINITISNWQKQHIEFLGIFHSHLDFSEHLSSADEEYIKKIMYTMPDKIKSLYFPLVLPKSKIILAYKAIRYHNSVNIIKDDVKII